jgi:hypothetical protein
MECTRPALDRCSAGTAAYGRIYGGRNDIENCRCTYRVGGGPSAPS